MDIGEVVASLDGQPPSAHQPADSIPTGSLGLDIGLGGGWLRGAICELSGDYSTYKTAFALHTVAQVQKVGGPALWLDSGSDFNPEHASRVGVNLGLLTICYPDDVDRAMYTMRIAAEDYALMVLDSASGLDWDNDETPPMIDRCFALLKRDLGSYTTALFISNDYATKDQRFTRELHKWSSQQVRMMSAWRGLTEAVVLRNPAARPVNYHMRYRFASDGTFDTEYELVRLGIELGIIQTRGSWGYFGGEKIGHGMNGMVQVVRNNPRLAPSLAAAIRDETETRGI